MPETDLQIHSTALMQELINASTGDFLSVIVERQMIMMYTHKCPSGEKTVIALSYREPMFPPRSSSLSRCHAKPLTLATAARSRVSHSICKYSQALLLSFVSSETNMLRCHLRSQSRHITRPKKAMHSPLQRAPIFTAKTALALQRIPLQSSNEQLEVTRLTLAQAFVKRFVIAGAWQTQMLP